MTTATVNDQLLGVNIHHDSSHYYLLLCLFYFYSIHPMNSLRADSDCSKLIFISIVALERPSNQQLKSIRRRQSFENIKYRHWIQPKELVDKSTKARNIVLFLYTQVHFFHWDCTFTVSVAYFATSYHMPLYWAICCERLWFAEICVTVWQII